MSSIFDKTLDQIFEEQVQKNPNLIAVLDANQQITYQELNQKSNQLANAIRSFSNQREELVGLFLERSIETVVAILAVLKAGGAYLPLDPNSPPERLQYILEQSNCNLVLTQTNLVNKIEQYHQQHIIDINTFSFAEYSNTKPKEIHSPKNLAYVLYTSGTTGKPKGVCIPHEGVINRLAWMQKEYPIHTKDVILQKTPYTFDVSVWEFLWPLQVGAKLFIASPNGHQDPNYLEKCIKKNKISVMHFVPSMLTAFCKSKPKLATSLRYVFCSGEQLLASQVHQFYQLCHPHVEVHNLYGPTEASIDVTYFYCPKDVKKVMIGKPIDNIQVAIFNENKQPVSMDEIGELHIAGIGLARGYLNQEKLTHEKFITVEGVRYYATGDLVKMDSHGDIEYIGRNDFQVKIRGYRIELNEIESVLSNFPGIHQTAVLTQSKDDEPVLIAYYESDSEISSKILSQHLQKHLPNYMIPSGFIHLKEFPVNTNGKLCRKSLPPYQFAQQKDLPYSNDPISVLTAIWEKELGIQPIDIHDEFYALGGHSLAAARIVSSIKKHFNKHIELEDFYVAKSIFNLEKKLENAPHIQVKPEGFKISSKKQPLTDFQLLIWLSTIFEPNAKKMNIVSRKRLEGTLDLECFKKALQSVINNQEALRYKISIFVPYQKLQNQNNQKLDVTFYNLQNDSTYDIEEKLLSSMNDLIDFYQWSYKFSLLKCKIFQLPQNKIEIQLAMPHIICDETSIDILWEQISKAYINEYVTNVTHSFKEYIHDELTENNKHFDLKLHFWKSYLRNATLFHFPKNVVVDTHLQPSFSYSSYYEISESLIEKLKSFAQHSHISLHAILMAGLTQALIPFCQENKDKKKFPLFNFIKSNRIQSQYDQTIGCMIRIAPIKIAYDHKESFFDLCQKVQEELVKHSELQNFSSLLKFSFHTNCFKFKNILSTLLIRIGMPLYTLFIKLNRIPYINFTPINNCWRLAAFDRKNIFLVNFNVWNNFSLNHEKNESFFGLQPAHYDMANFDLTQIDDLLDVCFIREHSNHKPYLVLSGNLSPEFKNTLFINIFDAINKLIHEFEYKEEINS